MKKERLYVDNVSAKSRLQRLLWAIVYATLFRWTPRFLFSPWRIFLLRQFGAKIGAGCKIAPSCFIWAPWNLEAGNFVCLADGVDCYTIDRVILGDYSTVSQRAFLCTASHDISKLQRPLTHSPIVIGEHAWVCAEAFVGPGVTIGRGAVIGAKAVVLRDVDEWTVVAGNPAKKVKVRQLT